MDGELDVGNDEQRWVSSNDGLSNENLLTLLMSRQQSGCSGERRVSEASVRMQRGGTGEGNHCQTGKFGCGAGFLCWHKGVKSPSKQC